MGELGDMLRRARLHARKTPQQVAADLGYPNLNGGAHMVLELERGEVLDSPRLPDLCRVLGIPVDVAGEAISRDCDADREALAAEAAERAAERVANWRGPHMLVRVVACAYFIMKIPEHLSERGDIERYAQQYAKEHRFKLWLHLAPFLSIYINEDGRIVGPREEDPASSQESPRMTFRGRILPPLRLDPDADMSE